MIINHNILALNTARHYQVNNRKIDKNIAKLASGLNINSAADNAAGLAISSKMRGQIRGTEQAYRNSQDGISLLNTADGGMSGIHDVLQRMRELCIEAANDTLTNEDRQKIQAETNSLCNEINSIANNTEFNTIKLLCASSTPSSTPSPSTPPSPPSTPGVIEVSWSVPAGLGEDYVFSIDLINNTVTSIAIHNPPTSTALNNISGVRLEGLDDYYVETEVWASILVNYSTGTGLWNPSYPVTNSLGSNLLTYPATYAQLLPGNVTSDVFITWQFVATNATTGLQEVVDLSKVEKVTFFEYTGTSRPVTIPINGDDPDPDPDPDPDTNTEPLIIHVGANSDQQVVLSLPVDMRTDALGLSSFSVISSEDANASILLIDAAMATVSTERAKVGALQNRLEHITDALGNYSVNLSAAESRIRDVDMAKEMMNFTKNNILSQATTAMLSQANQQPQNVLTLLR